MSADPNDVPVLLGRFHESRRQFQERLGRIPTDRQADTPDGGEWSARDLVAHIAAWLDEANDRIPRLLAGAPGVAYDVDAFNAAAVERARSWTPQQALGALRRAADRFEMMVADMDPGELADSDDAMDWLRSVAERLMDEHIGDLERMAAGVAREQGQPS